MADKSLQFYRGPQSGIPTLKEAEPGWTTDEKRLYVGDGTNNVAIANKSEVDAVQSDLDTLEGKYNQILADAATKTELATKQDKLTGTQGQRKCGGSSGPRYRRYFLQGAQRRCYSTKWRLHCRHGRGSV